MKKLPCYVYTHRRLCGFSQPELAYLLGWKSGSAVSRVEKDHRKPKLAAVFALALLFGAAPADLFPKLFADTRDDLIRRAYGLHKRLQSDSSKKTKAKLEVLDQALQRARAHVKQEE